MSASWEEPIPVALAARMSALVESHNQSVQDAMLDSAILALRDLVRRDASEHDALDLLAIDGLITGAFAAAVRPEDLERLAERARGELFALSDALTR